MGINNYRRYLGVFAFLLGAGTLTYYFSDMVTWLVLAWIVSMLGAPIMDLLGKVKIGRFGLGKSIRATIVLLFFYAILGMFFYIFVPVVVNQGQNLAGMNYAAIAKNLEIPIAQAENWLINNGLMEGELSNVGTDSTNTVEDTSSTNFIPAPVDSMMEDSNRIPSFVIGFKPAEQKSNNSYTATIAIDSILLENGDTVTKTNIDLNVRVAFDAPKQQKQDVLHDTTAIVKPTDSPLEKFQKQIVGFFNPSLIPKVFSTFVAWLGHILMLLTSVTFIAFFFLKDEEMVARGLKAILSDRYAEHVDHFLSDIRRLLTRYFSGILLQITVITLYMSTLLWLFGIPNAILIAFFAALINVIPYIGPLIGAVFGIIVTISSVPFTDFNAEMLPVLINLSIIFGTMQLLDSFILQPFIFSNSVLAHPLEIFIVVIVGAQMGGPMGMVVAIPMYTIVRVIASTFFNEFKLVRQLTEQMNTIDDDSPPPKDDGA
ncbi:MAG: AI-2E family transporter [Saprospiraceae bacterium]|nr:AI-2E family transporter [Saprospiraceae bacterium]